LLRKFVEVKTAKLFTDFVNSEKSSGIFLICCTIISLVLSNVSIGDTYIHFWHREVLNKPLEFWINDGLMTIFFLLVGLEIEREIYTGELSNVRKSMLPVFAAIGGMLVPAMIHFLFNKGTQFQHGFGIPMATDIAFSLAILSLLGNRVPVSLKVFLTALAIIDDLGAILIIAIFYSSGISILFLASAIAIFILMLVMNRLRMHRTWIYFIPGIALWFCLYRAGIHPTISGVMLAFAIPFGNGDEKSPSFYLQSFLHKPVAFLILPLFALANTAIHFSSDSGISLINSNSIGIMLGLLAGKPIGIFLFSILGAALGFCTIPDDIKRMHLIGVGILAGIGFTMSIFISLLAFNDQSIINNSKIAVLATSFIAGGIGYLFLFKCGVRNKSS
jgi:NhaA family Na+:H+ antiporter